MTATGRRPGPGDTDHEAARGRATAHGVAVSRAADDEAAEAGDTEIGATEDQATGDKATEDGAARPSLWRQRDFLLLWGGQIASVLGSQVTATAMPLLVLAITGSPGQAGIVAAAAMLPQLLFQLPAGVLIDRTDRRRVMLAADAGRFVVMASIPVALLTHSLSVAQLVVVSFVDGLGLVLFNLAENASLPRVVPGSLLPAALAQNESKDRGAALAGRPLGGILYAAGRGVPFLADAVSYLVSLVGVLALRTDLRAEPRPRTHVAADLVEGLRWLWHQPFLRMAVLLVAVSNMVFQAEMLALVVRAQQQHASASMVGVMLGMAGAGGLLGALLAGRLHRLFSPSVVVIGVNWYWVVVVPLFLLAPNPWVLGAIAAVSSFVGPMWNVVLGTYRLRLTPDRLRGRVESAEMTVAWGVLPLGSLLGGFLLQAAGFTATILAMTAALALTALVATASPAIRHVPPLGTQSRVR